MNRVNARMEHQPKNSISRLQMEVAARRKTTRRHGIDQKSRLSLTVFCTDERCRVTKESSRDGREMIWGREDYVLDLGASVDLSER